MSRPVIETVEDHNLAEFAAFLHGHLNSSRSVEAWVADFRGARRPETPNYGFVVRDQGRIVGAIGALYAERLIDGRPERFCNITSWCVLDAFRAQSMRLAMALLAQPGWHFTDFSPTKVVGATLKFLKFVELDESLAVMPNLPGWPGGARVLTTPADLQRVLQGSALQDYQAHARFEWLRHLAVGTPAGWCHVIYKKRQLRGLPVAGLLHASDKTLLEQHLGALRTHLLLAGFVFTQIECRWLSRPPPRARIQTGFNRKVFLSKTLLPPQIDYLYSESVIFDL